MNKRIGVVGLALVLSFMLLDGLLILAQEAETAIPAEIGVKAPQEIILAIPETIGLEPAGVNRIFDLWDYTAYTGTKTALVYTVTTTYGGHHVAVALQNSHYVSMTSLSDYTSGYATVQVDVSDGQAAATDEFEVALSERPVITVPDQTVTAGQVYEDLVDLKDVASDDETYDSQLEFSLVGNPPAALGVAIDAEDNLDASPALTLSGIIPVTVQVTDGANLTDTSTFSFTVVGISNTVPSLFIPDQVMRVDSKKTLDLLDFTDDPDAHDQGNLVFTITEVTNAQLGVTLTGTHYLNIEPDAGVAAIGDVSIHVKDTFATTDTTTFQINVTDSMPPSIDIPDMAMMAGTTKQVDLWNYTSYFEDAKSDLVYTPTMQGSDTFTYGFSAGHFLNFTSTSPVAGGTYTMNVTVANTDTQVSDSFTIDVQGQSTLTLDLPTFYLRTEVGDAKTIDLWDYTYYDKNMDDLVYTVSQYSGGGYVTINFHDGHYLDMTSDVYYGAESKIDLEVSDGEKYSAQRFEIHVNAPPEIDFYPNFGGYKLPNPMTIFAGRRSYFYRAGGDPDTPAPFNLFIEEDDGSYYVSLLNEPPVGLGAEFTRTTEGHLTMFFDPEPDFYGTHFLTIGVKGATAPFTASDMFTVTVMQEIYLPLVKKNDPPVVRFDPIENPDGDAIYDLRWYGSGDGYYNYDLQYSKDDPTFLNPTTIQTSNNYRFINDRNHYELIKPGTYYWRARVQGPADDPNPWSNVQGVSVGNFAYLYVDPLCAYGLRVEVWGNGQYFVKDYPSDEYCNETVFWRSVPAGTYTSRLSWLGGSIVDNVGATALGNDRYRIIADQRPPSWQPY